jgi:crotonobetainyl-CoA:carnitine CoA-transferase CaiB-like acyl-CoA transferase
VLEVAEVVDHPQHSARRVVGTAHHPIHGEIRQLAPLLAGMERANGPVALSDPGQTDTEHLLKEAGVDGDTVARWLARGVVA